MAKPYSKDLRIRVINKVNEENVTHSQVSDTFKIGIATVRRWIELNRDTGGVEPRKAMTTKPRKIDYEEARKFIENNPDKTLKEIGDAIGTKDALYVIRKLGITYKKTLLVRGAKGRFERRISKNSKSDFKRKSNLS